MDQLSGQPPHVIYTIARADVHVYNVLLRLCRGIYRHFPLALRLDYMIDFGVTVEIRSTRARVLCQSIAWRWNCKPHDVFGPAIAWTDGDVSYRWRGQRHRIDGPARVWRDEATWFYQDVVHRDPAAPAGTGVDLLRGVASLVNSSNSVAALWYTRGELTRSILLEGPQAELGRAEIAYWYTRRL